MKKKAFTIAIGSIAFITATLLVSLGVKAQVINTIAGTGTGSFGGDGGAATAAQLRNPNSTKFDAAGNMYIADYNNHRIRKIDASGIISTIAGTGGASFSGDGGAATAAVLNSPVAVAVDGSGNVYFSDRVNNRIRKINTSGIISTVAGTGAASYTGDGGAATAATLNYPGGLNTDASGNVYIADENNNVIRKITVSTGIITTVAGTGTGGFSGDGGSATTAKLNHPKDVFVNATGELYIADYTNHRIRRVNAAGTIATFAGTGVGGFSGDGGTCFSAQLYYPTSLWIDATGVMLLTDSWNNRVRQINTGFIITTIAGMGSYSFSGDGGAATAAGLKIGSVVADAAGNIYISDDGNHRIRKITPAPPVVSGNYYVCDGGDTTQFSSTVTGGTWSSSDATIATVDAAGIVTGVATGSASISYTASSGGVGTWPVTVSATPAISGTPTVCIAATTTLSASIPGGFWGSLSAATATVNTSGLVTGIAADTVTVGYVMTTGCYARTIVTVDACTPTDISASHASRDEMNIYPNPSNASFTISMPLTANAALTITDMIGSIVYSKPINGTSITVTNMPPGNYYVKLTSQERTYGARITVMK